MTKTIASRALIATAALTATLASSHSVAFAAERAQVGTMKPTSALTFEFDGKKAVSYFLANGNTCQLVLTIADDSSRDDSRYEATRFEAAIPGGQSTRYGETGHAIDFSCDTGARAMSANEVDQIATGIPGR